MVILPRPGDLKAPARAADGPDVGRGQWPIFAPRLVRRRNSALRLSLVGAALVTFGLALSACAEVGPLGPFSPCAKTAAPISTETVITALGDHGFSVKPDPYGCGGAVDIHVTLSNATDQESYDTNKAEGLVGCAVRSRPLWGETVTIRTQKGGPILNPKVFGDVLNVDCQLGDGDHLPSEEQVARLRAALEQMLDSQRQR